LTPADAEFLRQELLHAAREASAIRGDADEYGSGTLSISNWHGTIAKQRSAAHGSFVVAENFRA